MEVFGSAGTGVLPKQQVVDGQLTPSVILTLRQQLLQSKHQVLSPRCRTAEDQINVRLAAFASSPHLQGGEGRAAAVAGSGPRFCLAQPGSAPAVEGRLDGDGGVARAVEPQGVAVAGVSRVTGDHPGQVGCHTPTQRLGWTEPPNVLKRAGPVTLSRRSHLEILLIH